MEFHNEITMLNIDDLIKNPYNVTAMTKAVFEALKKDICENGFFGGIIVRPHPLKKGKFEVIDREKRLKALKELGEPKIPCIIVDYNDLNTIITMIRINREHGYFDKKRTNEVIDDLIKKTNKLFIREILHCNLKEFDDLIDDNPRVFKTDNGFEPSKYTNILQESEKAKRLFY